MGDTDLEKITEEINLLKKLNHPNIINYISGWFDENKNEIVIITKNNDNNERIYKIV